jgi:hypothetical protein
MTANPQLAALRIELRERADYVSWRRDYLYRLRQARETGNSYAKRSAIYDALFHRYRAGIGTRRCILTGRPYLQW